MPDTARDVEIAARIRNADLEIARVLRRFGEVGGLIAARQQLAAAVKVMESPKPEEWTPEQILAREG